MRTVLVFAVCLVAASMTGAADGKITKQTFESGGTSRTYYLLVPDRARGAPSPLLILLHGSGRDGRVLLTHWEGLAKKEGIILAGPDAMVREGWGMREDGPHFVHDLVQTIRAQHAVDQKRMYLFGHSAGAIHGLALGVLESEYFAAVAVHAGVLTGEFVPYIDRAPRKTHVGRNGRPAVPRGQGEADPRRVHDPRVRRAVDGDSRAHPSVLRSGEGHQRERLGIPPEHGALRRAPLSAV